MLQLHALVNNPITTTVTENIIISAKLEQSTPSGKISISTKTQKPSITIPNGITVVKVTNDWIGDIYYVGITSGKTYIFDYCYTYEEGGSGYYSAGLQRTNRSVNWFPSANYPEWESWESYSIDSTYYIEYSSAINTVSPSITDY